MTRYHVRRGPLWLAGHRDGHGRCPHGSGVFVEDRKDATALGEHAAQIEALNHGGRLERAPETEG